MVYRLSIVTGSFIFCLGLVLEVAHFWERPEIHGALLVFWETMDIYIYIGTLIDYMDYDYINLDHLHNLCPFRVMDQGLPETLVKK